MVEPVDSFLMMNLRNYQEKNFHNIDQAAEEPKEKDKEDKKEDEAASLKDVVTRFKTTLGEKVVEVKISDRLVNSPCRLVTSGGVSSDMERVFHYMSQARQEEGKPFSMAKRNLEINKSHKIIENLEAMILADDKNPLIDLTINQLFQNAALQEGLAEKPVEMIPDIQKLMEIATSLSVGKSP